MVNVTHHPYPELLATLKEFGLTGPFDGEHWGGIAVDVNAQTNIDGIIRKVNDKTRELQMDKIERTVKAMYKELAESDCFEDPILGAHARVCIANGAWKADGTPKLASADGQEAVLKYEGRLSDGTSAEIKF